MPVLIIHGKKDNTIPFMYAQKLYDRAREPKKLIEIPEGGHNDLYNFGASQHILNFLTGISASNPK